MCILYENLPIEQGTGEILADPKTNFCDQKLKSLAVSAVMNDEILLKRGQRMFDCGSILHFAVAENGDKRLYKAYFCKDRMCPSCQRRRSLVTFHQVKNVSKAILSDFPTFKYILLTLTVPNVSEARLGDEIKHLVQSWKRLTLRKDFKAIKGWFRTLEVTYNGERNDYHPHFHVLLCVPSNYFKKNYIKQDRWLELWRDVTRYPEITQVDVRTVKPNPKRAEADAITSACGEVGKYATKPTNYLARVGKTGKYLANEKVVKDLAAGIKGKKLIAFGGLMLEYSKKLELDDVNSDNVDLIHTDGDTAMIDAVFTQVYRWNVGLSNFVSE